MALSAVTATVQFWLNNVFNDPASPLGGVSVTAVAPDLAQASLGKTENSDLLVNLFLHQVTPNAALRNAALPRLGSDGTSRLANQPLALDLHYLLTAYGSKDTEAEALLGYAVLMLHETPVLAREQIRTALAAVPSTNPYYQVLKNAGLADQIEMIKITPATLGREEMAWLWTALKADYRPTFPFQVSVVLIQPEAPTVYALPVLKRMVSVQAGLGPHVDEIDPPANQAAPAPGDTATMLGQSLSAITRIVMVNSRLGVAYPPFAPASSGDASVTFMVPDDPSGLPSGVYAVTGQITDGSGNVTASTNSVLLGIAPRILATPAPVAVNNTAGTLVTIHVSPQVLPQQQVSLILGSNSAPAVPFTAPTDTLSFQFPNPPLAAGDYVGRLSIDGIVSAVQVDWGAAPPAFIANVLIP